MTVDVINPSAYAARRSPFLAARRALTLSLFASVLVPLTCLVVHGYLDYDRRLADINTRLLLLSRVAQEHALKMLDMNAALVARTMDLLGNKTRDEIRQREPQIHRRLEAMVAGYPQIASLSVFGQAGDLIASSRYSPPPAAAIADRGGFHASSPWYPYPYISLPQYRRIDGETVLVSSVARASDGSWREGVISVALRRKYLIDFYAHIIADKPGYIVSLYRREGAALLASSSPDALTGGLEHDGDFTQALRENVIYGGFVQNGSGRGDNAQVSFRRVGEYPVYVACTFDFAELRSSWWRSIVIFAAITLIPGAALATWISVSLLRLRAYEAGWSKPAGDLSGHVTGDASSSTQQETKA